MTQFTSLLMILPSPHRWIVRRFVDIAQRTKTGFTSPGRELNSSISGREMSAPSEIDKTRARLSGLGKGSIDLDMNQTTGIASICINNPVIANGISGRMMVQLETAVAVLERWSAGKAVLLHAVKAEKDGRNWFCSGEDVAIIGPFSASRDEGLRLMSFMQNTLSRLSALPMISVAVLAGGAQCGGAELCLATDFRLCTNLGSVRFVQARRGLVPAWGAGARLVQLLGSRVALDLLTSCRRVEAAEAVHLGLADVLLDVPPPQPAHDVLGAVRAWLEPRISYDTETVRNIKRVVQNTAPDLTDILHREQELFAETWIGYAEKHLLHSDSLHNSNAK